MHSPLQPSVRKLLQKSVRSVEVTLRFLGTISRRFHPGKMQSQRDHQMWITGSCDRPAHITKQWDYCRICISDKAQQAELGGCENGCVATLLGSRHGLSNVIQTTLEVPAFELDHCRDIRHPCTQRWGQGLSEKCFS